MKVFELVEVLRERLHAGGTANFEALGPLASNVWLRSQGQSAHLGNPDTQRRAQLVWGAMEWCGDRDIEEACTAGLAAMATFTVPSYVDYPCPPGAQDLLDLVAQVA